MSFDDLNEAAQEAATPPAAAPSVDDLQAQLAAATAALAARNAEAAATAVPADEPEPEPAPVITPEVVPVQAEQQAAVDNALVTAQAAGFLANINTGDTMGALMAAVESDDVGGSSNHLYPILTQVGGTSGGAFQRAGHMSANEAANLPEGMKPFMGVFMGYRFSVTAWEDGGGPQATKKMPVFSCALPASEKDLTNKLMTLAKEYQFTKGDKKGKYDVAAGGPGHVRPQLEMLIFDPDYNELFTFQTCSHYNATKDTRDQLIKNATETQPGVKAMLPFVGSFTPKTVSTLMKNGNTVVYHYAQIDRVDVADVATKKAWDAWQSFSAQAQADASILDKVNQWFGGQDAQITQQCRDALTNGIGI